MEIQSRILAFVTWTNWVLFFLSSGIGLAFAPFKFALGIIAGGIIVTTNFHLLYRTLKSSFAPPHTASIGTVLTKYYLRFATSVFILGILIWQRAVDPLALFIGLSIVVVSIFLSTILELTKLVCCKEAT